MFYYFDVFKLSEKITVNGLGQEIKTYSKNQEGFKADLQPIDAHIALKDWGEEIKNGVTMFTDESLNIGDYVFSGKSYRIVNVKDWVSYKIYLLDAEDLTYEEN